MTDLPREAREALRRLHMHEPIEIDNPHAHAAAAVLRILQGDGERVTSPGQLQYEIGLAQTCALLALTQEVKNLRLAMYPHSGESP